MPPPPITTLSSHFCSGLSVPPASTVSKPMNKFFARLERAVPQTNWELDHLIHMSETPQVNPAVVLSPLGTFPRQPPANTQMHRQHTIDRGLDARYSNGVSYHPNRRTPEGDIILGHVQSVPPASHSTPTADRVRYSDVQHQSTVKPGRGGHRSRRIFSAPVRAVVNLCRKFRGFLAR